MEQAVTEELVARYEKDLENFSVEDLLVLRWNLKWKAQARRKQLAPKEFLIGKKPYWGIRSGRGFGKTLCAANWIGLEGAKHSHQIEHVIAPTYDDARYTCFEGPTGLVNIIPEPLIVDQNKSLPSLTLWNGTIFRGFAADTPNRLRGPQCVPGHTLVHMGDGSGRRIDQIRVGDHVLTSNGSRRVLDAWSSGIKPLWRLRTRHGRVMYGTMDHLVLADGAWTPLCQLKPGQSLLTVESTVENPQGITSGSEGKERNDTDDISIEMSTRGLMARSLEAILSITGTRITRTIRRLIWKRLRGNGILHIIRVVSLNLTRLKNFIDNQLKIVGIEFLRLNSPVLVVSEASPFGLSDSKVGSSVARDVEMSGEDLVLSVESCQSSERVFDLTVEEDHEFFSNGILVHNCHNAWGEEIATWMYPKEAWSNIEFGLRLGEKPRMVWTSTPRPTQFMRDRNADPRAIIVTGSLYENRENLADIFFENVAKYEGTAIGRQEIHGEILDPEEEGFVKRSQWQLWPAKQPLPKFKFIVMSLDTAFTEDTYDKKKNTSDFTACTVWGVFDWKRQDNVMLIDAWQDRLGFPDLVKRTKKEMDITYGDADEPLIQPFIKGPRKPNHQGRRPDLILIEDKGSGISLRQSLANENIFTESYNPGKLDKLARLHIVSPLFAHRRVWAVESNAISGKPRTWADPVISQVCTYVGQGSLDHDDLLDTATQALRLIMDKFRMIFTVKVDAEDEKRKAALALAMRRRKEVNPYAE